MSLDQEAGTDLRELAGTRLTQLRRQLAEGESALAELDSQREQLVANLLRISGAVQVLAELVPGEPE
jgi:predicted negative regulator of RcsB-dependent stress response